jgi:hypothetical protein
MDPLTIFAQLRKCAAEFKEFERLMFNYCRDIHDQRFLFLVELVDAIVLTIQRCEGVSYDNTYLYQAQLPQYFPELGSTLQLVRRLLKLLRGWEKLMYFLLLFLAFAGFPKSLRHLCTTMPWTIWPALVVLWGVCWMFYSPTDFEAQDFIANSDPFMGISFDQYSGNALQIVYQHTIKIDSNRT